MSQNIEEIALESLTFLNKEFNLHLEKIGKPILISMNGVEYLCYKYINKDSLPSIERIQIKYTLKRNNDNDFSFILKVYSEYTGSFRITNKYGKCEFENLKFIQRSH